MDELKDVCICTPTTDLAKMFTLRFSNSCVLQVLSSNYARTTPYFLQTCTGKPRKKNRRHE